MLLFHQHHCLCFCLFLNQYINATSSTVAMFVKLLTLGCPLVDVLRNVCSGVKDTWKYGGGVGRK